MNLFRRELFEKATRYLEDHLCEEVSVRGVAKQLGVSRRTLHLAFRDNVSLAPKAWLTKIRLRHARQGLLSGLSVTEAALGSGFSHFGRFGQLYRSEFGELPSATQRQARCLAALSTDKIVSKTSWEQPCSKTKSNTIIECLEWLVNHSGPTPNLDGLHEILYERVDYQRGAIIVTRKSDARPFIFSHCRNRMTSEAFRTDMRRVNGVLEASRGIVHSVLQSGTSRVVGNVLHSPEYAALDPMVQSEMCVPILRNGEIIGAVNFESHMADAFDVHDLALAHSLAGVLGAEISAQRETGSLGLSEHI